MDGATEGATLVAVGFSLGILVVGGLELGAEDSLVEGNSVFPFFDGTTVGTKVDKLGKAVGVETEDAVGDVVSENGANVGGAVIEEQLGGIV